VAITRSTGAPSSTVSKMRSHAAIVSSEVMPQSMIVKPATPSISSSSSHRLIWSSAKGSGMRSQWTPGRRVVTVPAAGTSDHG